MGLKQGGKCETCADCLGNYYPFQRRGRIRHSLILQASETTKDERGGTIFIESRNEVGRNGRGICEENSQIQPQQKRTTDVDYR